MVRTLACLVAVALATLLSACCPEDPFYPTLVVDTTIKDPAYLRVIHAAADAPMVTPVMGGDPFHGPTPYLGVNSGVNEARYYPADTSWKTIGFLGGGTMLATAPISMEKGAFYTAYLHGRPGDYRVLVTRDTVEAPSSFDELKVRLVNLAPDAPAIDVFLSTSPDNHVARNLAYGQASPYSLRGSVDIARPGITIKESATGSVLLDYPSIPFLFGKATLTLVVTGHVRPSGVEPMLGFAAYFESTRDDRTGLFGSGPLLLRLFGMRLINLVPTTQTFDLAIWDPSDEFKPYGGYRRNYPGMDSSVKDVPSLTLPEREPKPYFLQKSGNPWSPETNPWWRYRIERKTVDGWNPAEQTPISNPDTLFTKADERYTIVVFGPDTNLRVRTVELSDNVPAPSLAQSRVRFFHGGYGALDASRLRLRVGAVQTPLMAYGEAPSAASAVDVSAGSVTLEVVDQNGTVVASTQATLEGGVATTVFLAPRGDGSGWIIRPVADRLRR